MSRRLISISLTLLAVISTAVAQQTFSRENVEYTFDLPSNWKVIQEPDALHAHAEFVNGERNEGLLRIRKEVVEAGTTAADLSKRDQEQRLRFQPGYVEGKEEKFAGSMNGVLYTYEYTNGGKPFLGRIYYLQADNRSVYTLRFTGNRDKLQRMRSITDAMARSFRLK